MRARASRPGPRSALTVVWSRRTLPCALWWSFSLEGGGTRVTLHERHAQQVIPRPPHTCTRMVPSKCAWCLVKLINLYPLMATIVAIWPNWVLCRIGKFNYCTFTTLILKNLHHWFVFISDFRTYQVFSGPCISQCMVLNWKALMLISPHFS